MLEPIVQHSSGSLVVGTAGSGVTALEYKLAGNDQGTVRMTNLSIDTDTVIGAVVDTAAVARGILIYTFPAGQIIVKRVYGDLGLDVDETNYDEDTPEIGLGTAVASGANATLGDAATGIEAENLWGPHVAAGCDTKATAADAGQFISVPEFIMAGAGDHTVYLNIADTWANGTGTPNVTVENGRFIIEWILLPIEGV